MSSSKKAGKGQKSQEHDNNKSGSYKRSKSPEYENVGDESNILGTFQFEESDGGSVGQISLSISSPEKGDCVSLSSLKLDKNSKQANCSEVGKVSNVGRLNEEKKTRTKRRKTVQNFIKENKSVQKMKNNGIENAEMNKNHITNIEATKIKLTATKKPCLGKAQKEKLSKAQSMTKKLKGKKPDVKRKIGLSDNMLLVSDKKQESNDKFNVLTDSPEKTNNHLSNISVKTPKKEKYTSARSKNVNKGKCTKRPVSVKTLKKSLSCSKVKNDKSMKNLKKNNLNKMCKTQKAINLKRNSSKSMDSEKITDDNPPIILKLVKKKTILETPADSGEESASLANTSENSLSFNTLTTLLPHDNTINNFSLTPVITPSEVDYTMVETVSTIDSLCLPTNDDSHSDILYNTPEGPRVVTKVRGEGSSPTNILVCDSLETRYTSPEGCGSSGCSPFINLQDDSDEQVDVCHVPDKENIQHTGKTNATQFINKINLQSKTSFVLPQSVTHIKSILRALEKKSGTNFTPYISLVKCDDLLYNLSTAENENNMNTESVQSKEIPYLDSLKNDRIVNTLLTTFLQPFKPAVDTTVVAVVTSKTSVQSDTKLNENRLTEGEKEDVQTNLVNNVSNQNDLHKEGYQVQEKPNEHRATSTSAQKTKEYTTDTPKKQNFHQKKQTKTVQKMRDHSSKSYNSPDLFEENFEPDYVYEDEGSLSETGSVSSNDTESDENSREMQLDISTKDETCATSLFNLQGIKEVDPVKNFLMEKFLCSTSQSPESPEQLKQDMDSLPLCENKVTLENVYCEESKAQLGNDNSDKEESSDYVSKDDLCSKEQNNDSVDKTIKNEYSIITLPKETVKSMEEVRSSFGKQNVDTKCVNTQFSKKQYSNSKRSKGNEAKEENVIDKSFNNMKKLIDVNNASECSLGVTQLKSPSPKMVSDLPDAISRTVVSKKDKKESTSKISNATSTSKINKVNTSSLSSTNIKTRKSLVVQKKDVDKDGFLTVQTSSGSKKMKVANVKGKFQAGIKKKEQHHLEDSMLENIIGSAIANSLKLNEEDTKTSVREFNKMSINKDKINAVNIPTKHVGKTDKGMVSAPTDSTSIKKQVTNSPSTKDKEKFKVCSGLNNSTVSVPFSNKEKCTTVPALHKDPTASVKVVESKGEIPVSESSSSNKRKKLLPKIEAAIAKVKESSGFFEALEKSSYVAEKRTARRSSSNKSGKDRSKSVDNVTEKKRKQENLKSKVEISSKKKDQIEANNLPTKDIEKCVDQIKVVKEKNNQVSQIHEGNKQKLKREMEQEQQSKDKVNIKHRHATDPEINNRNTSENKKIGKSSTTSSQIVTDRKLANSKASDDIKMNESVYSSTASPSTIKINTGESLESVTGSRLNQDRAVETPESIACNTGSLQKEQMNTNGKPKNDDIEKTTSLNNVQKNSSTKSELGHSSTKEASRFTKIQSETSAKQNTEKISCSLDGRSKAASQLPGDGKSKLAQTASELPGEGKTKIAQAASQLLGEGKTKLAQTASQLPGEGKTKVIKRKMKVKGRDNSAGIVKDSSQIKDKAKAEKDKRTEVVKSATQNKGEIKSQTDNSILVVKDTTQNKGNVQPERCSNTEMVKDTTKNNGKIKSESTTKHTISAQSKVEKSATSARQNKKSEGFLYTIEDINPSELKPASPLKGEIIKGKNIYYVDYTPEEDEEKEELNIAEIDEIDSENVVFDFSALKALKVTMSSEKTREVKKTSAKVLEKDLTITKTTKANEIKSDDQTNHVVDLLMTSSNKIIVHLNREQREKTKLDAKLVNKVISSVMAGDDMSGQKKKIAKVELDSRSPKVATVQPRTDKFINDSQHEEIPSNKLHKTPLAENRVTSNIISDVPQNTSMNQVNTLPEQVVKNIEFTSAKIVPETEIKQIIPLLPGECLPSTIKDDQKQQDLPHKVCESVITKKENNSPVKLKRQGTGITSVDDIPPKREKIKIAGLTKEPPQVRRVIPSTELSSIGKATLQSTSNAVSSLASNVNSSSSQPCKPLSKNVAASPPVRLICMKGLDGTTKQYKVKQLRKLGGKQDVNVAEGKRLCSVTASNSKQSFLDKEVLDIHDSVEKKLKHSKDRLSGAGLKKMKTESPVSKRTISDDSLLDKVVSNSINGDVSIKKQSKVFKNIKPNNSSSPSTCFKLKGTSVELHAVSALVKSNDGKHLNAPDGDNEITLKASGHTDKVKTTNKRKSTEVSGAGNPKRKSVKERLGKKENISEKVSLFLKEEKFKATTDEKEKVKAYEKPLTRYKGAIEDNEYKQTVTQKENPLTRYKGLIEDTDSVCAFTVTQNEKPLTRYKGVIEENEYKQTVTQNEKPLTRYKGVIEENEHKQTVTQNEKPLTRYKGVIEDNEYKQRVRQNEKPLTRYKGVIEDNEYKQNVVQKESLEKVLQSCVKDKNFTKLGAVFLEFVLMKTTFNQRLYTIVEDVFFEREQLAESYIIFLSSVEQTLYDRHGKDISEFPLVRSQVSFLSLKILFRALKECLWSDVYKILYILRDKNIEKGDEVTNALTSTQKTCLALALHLEVGNMDCAIELLQSPEVNWLEVSGSFNEEKDRKGRLLALKKLLFTILDYVETHKEDGLDKKMADAIMTFKKIAENYEKDRAILHNYDQVIDLNLVYNRLIKMTLVLKKIQLVLSLYNLQFVFTHVSVTKYFLRRIVFHLEHCHDIDNLIEAVKIVKHGIACGLYPKQEETTLKGGKMQLWLCFTQWETYLLVFSYMTNMCSVFDRCSREGMNVTPECCSLRIIFEEKPAFLKDEYAFPPKMNHNVHAAKTRLYYCMENYFAPSIMVQNLSNNACYIERDQVMKGLEYIWHSFLKKESIPPWHRPVNLLERFMTNASNTIQDSPSKSLSAFVEKLVAPVGNNKPLRSSTSVTSSLVNSPICHNLSNSSIPEVSYEQMTSTPYRLISGSNASLSHQKGKTEELEFTSPYSNFPVSNEQDSNTSIQLSGIESKNNYTVHDRRYHWQRSFASSSGYDSQIEHSNTAKLQSGDERQRVHSNNYRNLQIRPEHSTSKLNVPPQQKYNQLNQHQQQKGQWRNDTYNQSADSINIKDVKIEKKLSLGQNYQVADRNEDYFKNKTLNEQQYLHTSREAKIGLLATPPVASSFEQVLSTNDNTIMRTRIDLPPNLPRIPSLLNLPTKTSEISVNQMGSSTTEVEKVEAKKEVNKPTMKDQIMDTIGQRLRAFVEYKRLSARVNFTNLQKTLADEFCHKFAVKSNDSFSDSMFNNLGLFMDSKFPDPLK